MVLATIALLLARESKDLRLGEPADSHIVSSISADFDDHLSAGEVERIIATVERSRARRFAGRPPHA